MTLKEAKELFNNNLTTMYAYVDRCGFHDGIFLTGSQWLEDIEMMINETWDHVDFVVEDKFYRLNENGNAVIFDEDGEIVTRIDADVYPVDSQFSARYENPEGIVLTVGDAEKLGIKEEK